MGQKKNEGSGAFPKTKCGKGRESQNSKAQRANSTGLRLKGTRPKGWKREGKAPN